MKNSVGVVYSCSSYSFHTSSQRTIPLKSVGGWDSYASVNFEFIGIKIPCKLKEGGRSDWCS